MKLIEQIREGRNLIDQGLLKGRDIKQVEQKVKILEERLKEAISQLRFSEFSKLDISLEVDSDVLGCTIWFCPNEESASALKAENPKAVTYTADELLEILNLDPSHEDLNRIHCIKTIFKDSVVIDSTLCKDVQ